jgi:ABC-type branched-subunit amino acid transport system substrate-binding protein
MLLMHVSCVFGVLRIASVQTLNNSPSSLSSAQVFRDGEILWQEMINERGGVLINGTRHPVEIISIDVGAQTTEEIIQNIGEAVRNIANSAYGEIHATFAPLSSVFSEAHAIEAEKHKILSCAGGKSLLIILSILYKNKGCTL